MKSETKRVAGPDAPFFSVIVPVFNVEPYLRACLDSLLAQTFRDFEVIAVDDGSTDGCGGICEAYAAADPRVRVIHKPNGGLVSARNRGLAGSSGKYILYADGDDTVKPEMLSFIYSVIRSCPQEPDMVLFGADEVFDGHTGAVSNNLEEGLYYADRIQKEIVPYLFTDSRGYFGMGRTVFAHTWDKACRRELQESSFVRDERIRMLTDVPLTYECILKSGSVYVCNERLYRYNRTNAGSIRACGKEEFITEDSVRLVKYLRRRLSWAGPDIKRQLNEYPAAMIMRTLAALSEKQGCVQTARAVRERLDRTRMLSLVDTFRLPPKIAFMMFLWKAGFDVPAVFLYRARHGALRKP